MRSILAACARPCWSGTAAGAWTSAAGLEQDRLLRSIRKGCRIGEGLSDHAIWPVVEQAATQISIERFAAHDLRRTCAKLCRRNGGDLEQIKFLLGHSSIQATEHYWVRNRRSPSPSTMHLGL
jgi:integrase